MERLPDSSLIIGVATSTAERVHLARLLSGAEALLLVSSADQARAFLDFTTASASTPVVLTPGVLASGDSAAPSGDAVLPSRGSVVPTARGRVADLVSAAVPYPAPDGDRVEAVVPARSGAVAARRGLIGSTTHVIEEAAHEPAQVVELPAGLRLDEHRRVVCWKDREVPLTRLEHDFLQCLVEKPGQVWTYRSLHHAVWGNEHLGHGSHIHSVVKRLRQKLADLGAAVTIQAVRGVGFHLQPDAA